MGHFNFLSQCSLFADEVLVGVNTDEFVERYKGQRPLYTYPEREKMINLLGYPVYMNDSAGRELIERVDPDILAVGSDWARKDYYAQIDVDQDFLDERGIIMVYIPYTKVISVTDIRKRVARRVPPRAMA